MNSAEAEAAAGIQLLSRLGNAGVDAFASWCHREDGALADAIRRASLWAFADNKANEVVIDKRALLLGLLRGSHDQPAAHELNWLRRWAGAHGWKADDTDYTLLAAALYDRGGSVIPSRSVISEVLWIAGDLAQRASRRDKMGLRHLVMAVLRPQAGWGELGVAADARAFTDVRRQCLAWIRDTHGSEDDMSVWAELADMNLPPESLSTQSDDPASTDRLGRLPFAQVLAERIREARAYEQAKPGQSRAFMAHLHGPWGSGKSSILRFLREELRQGEQPWVTIDFNAWQSQSLRPIWWSIINEVRRQAAPQVDARRRRRMALTWWLWKLRADLLPVLLAAVLLAVAALGLFGTTMTADKAVPLIAAFIAAGGAIFALSRTLVFGSSHAARAYAELKTDPYTPVIKLFRRLVEAIDRPLLVCVDDVDRCDSATVVDLLEGIQTLLRDAPVTYAIAGDRKWICASFEKRYDDFNEKIGGPGRPLGYLFLDKMFQISTAVPRMSKIVREQYWDSLLKGDVAPAPSPAEAGRDLTRIVTQEELQTIIDTAEKPEDRQALRAAAALQITRPAARSEAESRFREFGGLLERNPRSMKLMINALGLNQALAFLEGRRTSPEALARWTILELRWPLLADWLSAHPEADAGCCPFPGLLDDSEVTAVMGGAGSAGRLDAAMLKTLHE